MRLPSASCIGAFSHLSMYKSAHGQLVCLRTARMSSSGSMLSKKALIIKIKNPVTTPASLPRHADRIERRFAGPVSVGIRVELWFHQRFQAPFDHRLCDAISYRGDPQRARLPIALGYVGPPHRWRKVAARRQTIPEFVEVVPKISLEVLNRLAVYASRPLVGSNPFIGFPYLPFRNVVRLCSIQEGPP